MFQEGWDPLIAFFTNKAFKVFVIVTFYFVGFKCDSCGFDRVLPLFKSESAEEEHDQEHFEPKVNDIKNNDHK